MSKSETQKGDILMTCENTIAANLHDSIAKALNSRENLYKRFFDLQEIVVETQKAVDTCEIQSEVFPCEESDNLLKEAYEIHELKMQEYDDIYNQIETWEKILRGLRDALYALEDLV